MSLPASRARLVSLVVLCLLAGAGTALATDSVRLDDGTVLKGRVLDIVDGKCRVETRLGMLAVDVTRIRRIDLEPGTAGRGGPTTRIRESWYHELLLGFPFYLGNSAGSVPHSTSATVDFLRFYFPLGPSGHLLAGGGINSSAFSEDGTGDRQFTLALYTAGIQYYPARIGQGWYGRLEAGLARGAVLRGLTEESSSPAGFGILTGVGYAFPVSAETSFLVQLTWARYWVSPAFNVVGLTAGWLW